MSLYLDAYQMRRGFKDLPPTQEASLESALMLLRAPRRDYDLYDLVGGSNHQPIAWPVLNEWEGDIHALDYQDPIVMDWIAAHNQAFVRYHVVDIDKDPAPSFPAMFRNVFFHLCRMDQMDFARRPNERYVFMSRQELISRQSDMRLARWPHFDVDLFFPGDKYGGEIIRVWNMWNRIPTLGYHSNKYGIHIEEVTDKIAELVSGQEGEGAEQRVYEYLARIRAHFIPYGTKWTTGFKGGRHGWLHMAPPIINNRFLNNDSVGIVTEFDKYLTGEHQRTVTPFFYDEITRPFLRNMASLFVVEGPN